MKQKEQPNPKDPSNKNNPPPPPPPAAAPAPVNYLNHLNVHIYVQMVHANNHLTTV